MENRDASERVRRLGIVHGLHKPEKRDYSRHLRREMTPSEALLWQKLRAGRLEGRHFRRQQIIDGFIVDFFCCSAGAIVEVDGAVHNHRQVEDEEREAALLKRNLRILRFSNDQIKYQMPRVLQQIREAVPMPKPK